MIRFVDSESLKSDYLLASDFDNIFGSINAFLLRVYSNIGQGLFWNIYDIDDNIAGNLSFVNDTFTVCVKDDNCVEELAQFIDFWGNFKFVKYNCCKVTKLNNILSTPHKIASGEILNTHTSDYNITISGEICKGVGIYDAFCLFKNSFPDIMQNILFDDFNYDMYYRLLKQESYIFGIKQDGILASAVEIMCHSDKTVLIGCVATDKNYRNNGYASSLLRYIINEFKDSNIYVFAECEDILGFYQKLGFKKCSEWAELTAVRKD